MANDSKIKLGDLDFDAIKSNLRDWFRSQERFQDYDFEGAGLNILLDVLAYNTHYNAFYLNMVANEMFLDTATKRASVTSHAKLLGYTPRSIISSRATADVTITKAENDVTSVLTLPRFTPFISESIGGASFRFLTTEAQTATAVGRKFTFTNLALKEGRETSQVFRIDNISNPQQIFEIPDVNIDTTTLQVIVQKSEVNTERTKYQLAEDTGIWDEQSKIYFLEENHRGYYQIYFGGDIIGQRLEQDNLVIVTYLVSNGVRADGITRMTLQTPLLPGSTSITTLRGKSAGGSFPEPTDEIRFNAPKFFIAQNRAITKSDYITILNRKYPYFDAVNVWGGEEEVPPVYGKVFISAKPKSGFVITEAEKQYIIDHIIKPMSMVTVTPEFVDPDYNYMRMDFSAMFDPARTTLNESQMQSVIHAAALGWIENNLNEFNAMFEISRLLRAVDDAEPSIQSSDAVIFLEKRITPDINHAQNYRMEFGTGLFRGVGADRFYSTPYYIDRDAQGIERECYIEESPYSFTGIESVEIVNPGAGYTGIPDVVIEGDGVGAVARAVIVNGRVRKVIVENEGTDYTSAIIRVVGGGGKNAELRPIISGRSGTLRSYYFRQDKMKVVLNPNAGTIDYTTGLVELTGFRPIDVGNDEKTLKFIARPSSTIFSATKSRLITHDASDASAMKITLIPVNS